MAHTASERTGRARCRDKIALGLSACVFAAGLASFALALAGAIDDAAADATDGATAVGGQAEETQTASAGLISSQRDAVQGQEEELDEEQDGGQTEESADGSATESDDDEKEGATASTEETAVASTGETSATEAASDEDDEADEAESPGTETTTKRYKMIRHTAYKRVAVYTTLQHTAAVACTTNVDGEDVTTWTLCAACGLRHSKSYTEKVVDHYENVYCTACGKKHSKSYTEKVEY